MEKEKTLQLLAEILEMEVKELNVNLALSELENWNSLSAISLIALADAEFNKTLKASDLEKFKTVEDIVEFLNV